MPPDEEHLHVFVGEQERELALALEPDAFEKLVWGKKVTGLRVRLVKAKPSAVLRLVDQAWAQKAPKSLLLALRATSGKDL